MDKSVLPTKINNTLNSFVQRLKDIYGTGLASVILYGSAARGEFVPKYSNIDIAIILDNTNLPNLAKASGALKEARFKIINPVFFTEGYIKRSIDVFPIEFLDMKESNILLYGRDILKDVPVDLKNLRFQCEHELKSKLLNIKRSYLKARNEEDLRRILFRFFTSSLHVLRNLMRLKGCASQYSSDKLLDDVHSEFGIDTAAFKKIAGLKFKNTRPGYKELEGLLFSFVSGLEDIAGIIDGL